MAAKKRKEEEEEFVNLSGVEGWINKNVKNIALGVLGIVAIAAFFVFSQKGKSGKADKAATAAVEAQSEFAKNQWANALNGTETYAGFAEIASSYKKTAIGNTSNYYAGVCEYKLGNYENALSFLKKFKKSDDAVINGLSQQLMGDAYFQLDDKASGLKHYANAAGTDSEILQADFIIRYAKALLEVDATNNAGKALAQFKKVADNFPGTAQSTEAQNYISALSN